MKIYKLGYVAAFAMLAMGITGCSEDKYTQADPVPEDCMTVYFTNANQTAYEIAPADVPTMEIELQVARLKGTEAASVPMNIFQNDDLFICPSTIEFAKGASTATVKIKMKAKDKGKFSLRLSIDDIQYANPYKAVEGSPLLSLSVEIVKWNLIGTGTFTHNSIWKGAISGMELYQREGTTTYKIPGWGKFAIDFFFTCNDKNEISVAAQDTGDVYASNGESIMVSTTNATAKSFYTPATKTYSFNCRYYISIGSFTSGLETLVLAAQ